MDQELLVRFKDRIGVSGSWQDVLDLARLFRKIERDPDSGCWMWIGARRAGGYGVVMYDGRQRAAHRVVFLLMGGTIPADYTLDHLCRNRACVNPAHLEACTLETNVLRGWERDRDRPNRNREKAVCPQGHLYDEANTRLENGSRKCRACDRERKAQRRLNAELLERERVIRRASYHRHKGKRLPPPAARTHCPKGHEYTPANTYLTMNGGRACRECRRAYERSYRARKRAATGG